jgi:hypothetical protein
MYEIFMKILLFKHGYINNDVDDQLWPITLYDLIIKYSQFIVKFPKIYILIGKLYKPEACHMSSVKLKHVAECEIYICPYPVKEA